MTRQRSRSRIALVLAVLTALTASGTVVAAPSTVPPETVETLRTMAADLVEQRTAALLASQASVAARDFAPSRGRASEAVKASERLATAELAARREVLASLDEAYTSASTDLRVEGVSLKGSSVVLDVLEVTTLAYAKIVGDEPPETRFATPRQFTFRNDAGTWVLESQRMSSLDGPAPTNEPTGATRAQMESVAAKLRSERQGTADLVAASESRIGSATTQPSMDGHLTGDLTALAGYSYSAMAAYAEQWWGPANSDYNPDYRSWAGTEGGGDCTNFVSQAMRAGGWQDVNGFYRDDNYWWYNWINQTRTWINVGYWYTFAVVRSGRTYILSSPSSMLLADVLQADFGNNGSKDHTMIVSYRSSTTPYLTYHSTNTYRKSLNTIMTQNPGARWLPHRT